MIIPICTFVASAAATWIYHRYANPKRIYCNDEGWQPIETIPEENRSREDDILITDGQEVYRVIIRDHDAKGRVTLGYPYSRVATHWRKMPMPPMRKD